MMRLMNTPNKKTDGVRLQKYLSEQGVCSRREGEDLIRNRRVKLNGEVATLGDKVKPGDVVLVNGNLKLTAGKPKRVMLAFHKPQGVETTFRSFDGGRSLQDFDFGDVRVFPVGRLDKASRGLLLMTNDGDLANTLMHPKYGHEKEYIVTTNRDIKPEDLKQMEQGIKIETGMTYPCKTEQVFQKAFKIILKEGKKRQIRRMSQALGYKVLDLLRVRFENVKLGELKPGKYRHLTETEIAGICKRKKDK